MSTPRIQSHFAANEGKWSYTVTLDGATIAQGSGYTSESVMRTHLDRDADTARRNLESAAAAARFNAERRRTVLLLAKTPEVGTAAVPLVRLLLKLPVQIDLSVVLPYGEVPEGVIVVGLASLGLDFGDTDLHRWAHDRVLPHVMRGGVFCSIESEIDDLVPPGGKRVFPFVAL